MKKLKTSILSRSAQLLGTASRIAGHEITQQIKNKLSDSIESRAPEILKTRIQQAKILAENLSQLKGAAMKVGQLLSIDSSDLIPAEVLEVLAQLQAQSEPVDFAQMEQVLSKEWSQELRAKVNVEKKAFSAASIGQVHRAQFNGKNLALKIQYPGVDSTIDSDLAILKKTVSAFLTLNNRSIQLDALFEELAKILKQETDYVREKELLLQYKKFIHSKNLQNEYIVPDVEEELCRKKVLAMTFEEGKSIKDWLESRPSAADRRLTGGRLLDLYCYEFFEWGLVQTDPNFGNFLIRDNNKLVLLDFGATLSFSKEFIDGYRNVLKVFSTKDDKKIIETSIDFGLIDPRENEETMQNYCNFMKLTIEPFSPHLQPFRFHSDDYMKRNIELGRTFTKSLRYSAPPRHIIFLHRKLGGIFNLMRKMEVELDLTSYWQKMMQAHASKG